MSVLSLVLGIIVIGLVVWLVSTYLPIDEQYKSLLRTVGIVIIVILVIVWVLGLFGVNVPVNLNLT